MRNKSVLALSCILSAVCPPSKTPSTPAAKKKKVEFMYKLSEEVSKFIKADQENKKLWEDVLKYRSEGALKFLAQVEEVFCCICCQDVVFKPVTTSCNHNVCKVRVASFQSLV